MRRKRTYIGLSLLGILILGLYSVSYSDIPLATLKTKYTNEHSRFIKIDGLDVHYRIEGQGPDLLLLHGTAASLHTWDDWTELLKKDFRIIRLDLPAFGLTGPSPSVDYSIAGYTSFLSAFTHAIGLDSFSVAGNSLGGGIAWAYAIKHPDQIEKMLLINASGIPNNGDDPAVFKLARNPVLGKLLEWVTPKSFIEKNMKEVYFNDLKVDEELVTRYHEMALREGNRKAFRQRAQVTNPDLTDLLPTISAPTLIMWGEEDEWIPVKNAYYFHESIPNTQLAVIPQLGHVPMEEAPDVTSAIARSFLLN